MKFIKFIRLARKRMIGKKEGDYSNYLAFQKFQAEEIINELKKRNIDLSDMIVLELGAGFGGYSSVFNKYAKELIISDLSEPLVLKTNSYLKFKKVDVTGKFPFGSNCFDFVFSCSLIEHIKHPENMLFEIRRVLKPGGFLYLSFPPFYSPIGGHSVKPFHFLGEKLAIKITNAVKKRNIKSYDSMHGDFGLFRRTIKSVKKLLRKQGFEIKGIWTRFLPLNTAKIPFLNEFLTWHVCFLCINEKS